MIKAEEKQFLLEYKKLCRTYSKQLQPSYNCLRLEELTNQDKIFGIYVDHEVHDLNTFFLYEDKLT